MAIKIPEGFKQKVNALGRGAVAVAAPEVAAGMLEEHLKGLPAKGAVEWVQQDASLLKKLTPDKQANITKMMRLCHDRSWMTTQWAITAIARSNKPLASLFIGWPEGRAWLEKQLKEIRESQ
jgi:hypothetical protein